VTLCRPCGEQFSGTSAFDRHRVGTHEYTFQQGIDHGVDDGRRCLAPSEMIAKGMSLNAKGCWQIDASVESARDYFRNTPSELRRGSESDSEPLEAA